MSWPKQRPSKRSLSATRGFYEMARTGVVPEPQPPTTPRKRKPREEREAGAMDAIKEWRTARGDIRLWRNNVGKYSLSNGAWVTYGLCPGSADFIGLRSVVVSPAMVGKRVALFFALEVKGPEGEIEPHQEAWLNEVRDAGGVAGVARNAAEAEEVLARHMEGLVR